MRSNPPCATRQELLTCLAATRSWIIDLGAMEIAAVANGKSAHEVNCIVHELAQAMSSKASLLLAYETHVSSHGCD